MSNMIGSATAEKDTEKAEWDSAAYDMYIDNALEMNKSIETLENTYYFSIPCSATVKNDNGTYSPVESKMEPLFVSSSKAMGAFVGETKGGYVIDESWQEKKSKELAYTVDMLLGWQDEGKSRPQWTYKPFDFVFGKKEA